MGMSYYSREGIYTPILTCDTCGEQIKDVRQAIITTDRPCGETVIHAAGIFHKGKCDPGNEAYPYSGELSRYLRHLVYNLRVGRKVNSRQLIIDLPEEDGVTECRTRRL